ncbi:phospholipase A-2-activating protein [Nematocida sp. AWRm80]|nr:phospholipase A-2-activating protein [Nematocida sp. AWRm80]
MEIESIKKIHSADIKECVEHSGYLYTVGRDSKIIVSNSSTLEKIEEKEVQKGVFINSIGAEGNNLYLGLQNGIIVGYLINGNKLEEKTRVQAHDNNVCSIRVRNNMVISSSWDGSISLWKDLERIETIKTEKSIWVADILENEKSTLIAGCTDGSILYFDKQEGTYQPVKGLSLHSSCIRDILVEKNQFISLSNTGVVLATEYSGKLIQRTDLDSISFRISKYHSAEKYIVSSDEGLLHILDKDIKEEYTLSIPVLSCWSAIEVNRNIAVCGSDGRLYLYTSIPKNNAQAKQDLQKIQEEYIEAKNKQETKPETDTNVSGNYKVENGKVYQKTNGVWELFGDQIQDKKDYNVTVELGSTTYTLSFNKTEEYETVARNFVSEHHLSTEYIPEIIEFLEKNFKGKKVNKVDLAPYTLYNTIALDGLIKKISDHPNSQTVIAFLKDLIEDTKYKKDSPEFKQASSEVEVILSEWMEKEEEKYPILDCYKYLISKSVPLDFLFLRNLNKEVLSCKKNALMYSRVATNILAYSPENKDHVINLMNRILDKKLIPEDAVRHYKKNLHLSK